MASNQPSTTANSTFELSEHTAWNKCLDEEGFCVIKGAASINDIEHATACLWGDMEQSFGALRHDMSTWSKIPNGSAGILGKCLPQSEGAWHIRALDTVKEAFSKIWGSEALIVSMDSVLIWLPWWTNAAWTPTTEGLHIDQNPFFKPEKCCVQGMVPLIDVTEESGGLEVVPRSHMKEARESFKTRHPRYQRAGFTGTGADWCPLNDGDPLGAHPQLVTAKAGDLILWDSRLLHGGKVGTTNQQDASGNIRAPDLARLSITVCMTKRSLASEDILKRRRLGFDKGQTFTHWPHEAKITCISPPSTYKLTPRQALLL